MISEFPHRAETQPGPGLIPPLLEPAVAGAEKVATPPRKPRRFRALLALAWRCFIGVLFSQSLLLSFLVVGWLQRGMQRAVLRRWWQTSELRRGGTSFEEFARSIPALAGCAERPHLILQQHFGEAWCSRGWKALFHSLLLNARLGVPSIFNTWVLTLPGLVLMNLGWFDGWNNSFTKGYEHAFAGPSISLLGIALFIAAMLYVPLAQAHQASSGSWRAFYQWRLVWRVARHRWLAMLGLALVYSAVSVPIIALRAFPQFIPQSQKFATTTLSSLTPQQIEQALNLHFLRAGFVVLAALLLVRWLAARIYAGGILRALRAGDIPAHALGSAQHAALDRLGHLSAPPPLPRHPVLDFAGRLASLAGRFAAGFAFVFVWFSFVAQMYVMQFLNYLPIVGWMNQPLVQLPWIKYLPHKATGELWGLLAVAVLALAVAGARSALRQLKTAKRPAPAD